MAYIQISLTNFSRENPEVHPKKSEELLFRCYHGGVVARKLQPQRTADCLEVTAAAHSRLPGSYSRSALPIAGKLQPQRTPDCPEVTAAAQS